MDRHFVIGYQKDQILNRSQDTDICLLVDTGQMTDQITGQIAGYSGQIKLPVIVARSD